VHEAREVIGAGAVGVEEDGWATVGGGERGEVPDFLGPTRGVCGGGVCGGEPVGVACECVLGEF